MRRTCFHLVVVALLACSSSRGADSQVSGADDPDFKTQGEYSGTIKTGDVELKIGVQIVALGEGKFHAVGFLGGLPGDGYAGLERQELDGQRQGDVVRFERQEGYAEVKDGVLKLFGPDQQPFAEIMKIERKSPTLGAKPPEGAVVLFDGSSAEQFSPGKMSPEGLLIAGATSQRKFQSCQLHVEFLLPFMPAARGQARGNSGVYLQGRYEVQMLDSFGLRGDDNECGGIYKIKAPSTNMCFPPLTWQTYDIDYTAAKYEDGKKVKNATLTVRHNGEQIHKEIQLPQGTTAAPIAEGPEPGPIYLQDHGNPVRYRNIWIVEKS